MRRAQSKRFAGCRIGRSHYDQHMEVSHLGCPFDKDPGDVIDNAYCHLEYDNRQDIWMPVCTVLYAEKSAGHVKQDTSGEHNIVHGQSTPAAPFFPSCHAPKCSSIASPLLSEIQYCHHSHCPQHHHRIVSLIAGNTSITLHRYSSRHVFVSPRHWCVLKAKRSSASPSPSTITHCPPSGILLRCLQVATETHRPRRMHRLLGAITWLSSSSTDLAADDN
jgi:hypothetical protein